tara:strand:- start:5504 stop:10198 length:4695 start_codon:yes stop_codon:yes gene_type:complete
MTNPHIRMALVLISLMVLNPWLSFIQPEVSENSLIEEQTRDTSNEQITTYSTSEGFTHTNMTTSPVSGVTALERPSFTWNYPGGIGSLLQPKTGGCAAYLPSLDQVLYIGGRVDPSPLQPDDESPTSAVDVFYNSNKSWLPSTSNLYQTQQYHGCATANNKIYTVGDLHPYSNPSLNSEGLMQVFDPSTGNWTLGTNMPTGTKVGLAGVESHNNLIYVAGGASNPDRTDLTNRLMRFDPVNNSWTQLANMSLPRHSFELVSFQGKLVAYGGIARYFDPIANQSVIGNTNLSEAYDPLTNTWTQLPNASKKFAAYAADVFNDELLIMGGYEANGWQITKNDKIYGYNPFTDEWNLRSSLQYGVFDSTITKANNTLVLAGGDLSSNRFSSWGSALYTPDGEYFLNPDKQTGWISSPIYDLSSSEHGSASPIWLGFSAIEPTGTSALMQYRTAGSEAAIGSAPWKPTTVPVYSYINQGNASLGDVSENIHILQYRLKMSTSKVLEWVTPKLVEVSFGGDEAAFTSSLPQYMQPTASAVDIVTHHHASTEEGEYLLSIHAADEFGSFDAASTWSTITWNTTDETVLIDDPNGLLFANELSVTPHLMESNGQNVTWSISLSGSMPTDYLRFKVSTHAERNASYLHPDNVALDKDVTVEVIDIVADYSSMDDATVSDGEVLPANTQLNVTIDHMFTNSGLRLLGGVIQVRLHTDVETYDLDSQNQRIWSNSSTQWFELSAGEIKNALLNLPEGLSGEVDFWLEARTSEDWNLLFDTQPSEFILNGEGPTLLSVSPSLDAYINEENQRVVSFNFHDVGGFSTENLDALVWIEARDDGDSTSTADGIAQRDEYKVATTYIDQNTNLWTINVSVNDSMNDDHQWVRVLLEGTDVAGFALPESTPDVGHIRWESRTPQTSTVEEFEQLGNLMTVNITRIEPSRDFGWKLVAFDPNGIDDISEIRIQLGNDSQLGLKYTVSTGICTSLDERLIVDLSRCVAEIIDDRIHLEVWAITDWSFGPSGLDGGAIELKVIDQDGIMTTSLTNRWSLQRDLAIEVTSVEDQDGPVIQSITADSSVMAGDNLNLTGYVSHLLSDTPYDGVLNLQWRGKILGELWRGGTAVTVEQGQLTYSIPTPIRTGLVKELEISLWDPLGLEKVASFDLPEFMLDGEPPELLSSNMASVVSRFHLESVEIGVNVREGQGWGAPLTLTCQVRSLDVEWDPVTLNRNYTTVFDGNTMFSFTFDFSGLGDPSTLPPQSSLACWAEGSDDSGWSLVSAGGNSDLDPWLITNLNSIGPDLTLEAIEMSSEIVEGETVRLSFSVVNAGESLPIPFNASIEIIQGDKRTLVGRSIFYSMDENSAKSIKRSFTAPAGTWSLAITIDQEEIIWELDENNNQWNKTYTSQSQGLSGLVMATGGVSLVALIGGAVLLRRRNKEEFVEEKVLEALQPNVAEPQTAKISEPSPPKARGPPGAKIASSGGSRPSKGPPRGPPKSKPSAEPTPQEMAAKYMDALGPVQESEELPLDPDNHAADYSQLPGGGEYEYTLDATYYLGEECGRWVLNDDKSFTKTDDVI